MVDALEVIGLVLAWVQLALGDARCYLVGDQGPKEGQGGGVLALQPGARRCMSKCGLGWPLCTKRALTDTE